MNAKHIALLLGRTLATVIPVLLGAHTLGGCMLAAGDDPTGWLGIGSGHPGVDPDCGHGSAAEHSARCHRPRRPSGLQVMTAKGPKPADFSCLDRRSAPASGPSSSFTLTANSFGQLDAQGQPVTVPGLEIQLFADNTIPDGPECGQGCSLATDLGTGEYRFSAAEGWLAYRVLERPADNPVPAVLRTVEVNLAPGAQEGFNAVFAPVLDGLHAALGSPRDATRSTLGGRIFDCNGVTVGGATVHLRDAAGAVVATTADTRAIYLGERGPDPSLEATAFVGQWSVINAPVEDGTIVIEARAQNGVLVGCERMATAPDALSVVRIGPLRADAPSECVR